MSLYVALCCLMLPYVNHHVHGIRKNGHRLRWQRHNCLCHSKRSRHPVSSPLVRDVEADNLLEKDNIVAMLASSDDPQLRPTLPY